MLQGWKDMPSKRWMLTVLLLLAVLTSAGCALTSQKTPPSAADQLQTTLMAAVAQDDLALVQQTVAQGADPLKPDQHGRSALTAAVDNRRAPIVRYLLSLHNGDSLEVLRKQPLVLAATRSGSVAVLETLLDAGFSLDVKTESGKTPLLIATSMGHTEMVKALISRGVGQSPDDTERSTALKLALTEQQETIADYLIGQGVPPFRDTTDVQTTYSSAISYQLAGQRALNLRSDQAKDWLLTAIDLYGQAAPGAETLSRQAEEARGKVWRSELLAYLLVGVQVAAGQPLAMYSSDGYSIGLNADEIRWKLKMSRKKFADISEQSKQRIAQCNELLAALEP